MSRRRGAQRHQDLLDDLASIQLPALAQVAKDDEASAFPIAKSNPSAFSLFNNIQGVHDDHYSDEGESADKAESESDQKTSNQSSSKRKRKKKNKNKVITSNGKDDQQFPPQTKSSQKGSSLKKKENNEDISLDDLDKAIREIKQKYGDDNDEKSFLNSSSKAVPVSINTMRNKLSVETRFLDAEAEMRRFFGSRVVKSDMSKHQKGRVIRKTILVNVKDNWPRPQGLNMELLRVVNGASYFTFSHNNAYKHIEYQFFQCISSYDPNTLSNLLQVYPFHVNTLLQLSEVAKQQGDVNLASQFIERALYSLERAFHPNFNLATGHCRLDFRHMESRPFYLAIYRYIQYIQRRGCWRTSFEFCKLLLALDPILDPYCALLVIDFYAIKAKKYDFLINISIGWVGSNLEKYPNIWYSIALAQFLSEIDEKIENHEKSSEMMVSAIVRYPMVIPLLYEKAGLSLDSSSIALDEATANYNLQLGPSGALFLIAHLYAEIANALYKDPDILPWLNASIKKAVEIINHGDLQHPDNKARKEAFSHAWRNGVDINLCRHVLVSELPPQPFSSFLPSQIMGTQSLMSYDPLPPEDSISSYDHGVDASPNLFGSGGQNTLTRLLRLLQDGGIGDRIQDDQREQLIMQLQEMMDAQQGTMPGGFENEEEILRQDGDDEGSNSLDEEEQRTESYDGWFSGIRNAVTRFMEGDRYQSEEARQSGGNTNE